MLVRDITLQDAQALCAIYNHYIEHTTITFEDRVKAVCASYPWLVMEEAGIFMKWAASFSAGSMWLTWNCVWILRPAVYNGS